MSRLRTKLITSALGFAGCAVVGEDPLNLRWRPNAEICHPARIKCDLDSLHAAYPNPCPDKPPDERFYQCLENFQRKCWSQEPRGPAQTQLYEYPDGRVSLLVDVPVDGYPVERLKIEGDWARVRLPEGYTGWIDRWAVCELLLGEEELN